VNVTIGVTSWFRRYTGGLSILELQFEGGETAGQIIQKAGIPTEEIGFITVSVKDPRQDSSFAVLEKRVGEEYEVADGDILKVYPMIIGG